MFKRSIERCCNGIVLTRKHYYYYCGFIKWSRALTSIASQTCLPEQGREKSPLGNVRVLDLSRILAGPFCTMLLGDLGAEIIKVEKPEGGDETRQWIPPVSSSGLSSYFISINRNKQSIGIDLKKGQEIIIELVKRSDVLVENFVPGTMERFGLGYKDLITINPRLIYASITGYGSTGPYSQRGGYDVIAASIGGLLHITGPRDGEPCKAGVAMTDLATGLYLHGAIMAALLQREKTNRGQRIDVNLLSTQVSCLVNLASNYLNGGGLEAQRWGTGHESIVPYEAFQTADGRWMTIGAGSNDLFQELCLKIELSHLSSHPKFTTNALRVKNRIELLNILRNKIHTKTTPEWLNIFQNSKFPYGPVNNIHQVFDDPQVKHSKLVSEIEGYKLVEPAVTFSEAENKIRSPPPQLGQHTQQILRNLLQFSEHKIQELYNRSIIA